MYPRVVPASQRVSDSKVGEGPRGLFKSKSCVRLHTTREGIVAGSAPLYGWRFRFTRTMKKRVEVWAPGRTASEDHVDKICGPSSKLSRKSPTSSSLHHSTSFHSRHATVQRQTTTVDLVFQAILPPRCLMRTSITPVRMEDTIVMPGSDPYNSAFPQFRSTDAVSSSASCSEGSGHFETYITTAHL